MELDNFQNFLHSEIPLTKQMGIELIEFSRNDILFKSPLEPNINDKGSVFGGSSSALQIIAAWSLIKLNCIKYKIDVDIVIHKNSSEWLKPLYQDFMIHSKFQKDYDFHALLKSSIQGIKSSIECESIIMDEDKNIFSTMQAKFVTIPRS